MFVAAMTNFIRHTKRWASSKTGGDNRSARIKARLGNNCHMAENVSMEEFEALLNESFEIDTPKDHRRRLQNGRPR